MQNAESSEQSTVSNNGIRFTVLIFEIEDDEQLTAFRFSAFCILLFANC